MKAVQTDAYDRFIVAFWRELKRMAVEPAISLGEFVGLLALAYITYRPPWLLSVPLMLAWLIWRNKRRG